MFGVCDHNQSGLDEVSFGIIVIPALNDIGLLRFFRILDILHNAVKSGFIDNCAYEIREIGYVTHIDGVNLPQQALLDSWPEIRGDVRAAGSRAFLALVLEGTTEQSDDNGFRISRRMDKDKIFSACLPHYSGIAFVLHEVGTDGLPHPLKNRSASSEMNPGQLRLLQDRIPDITSGAGNEVDHSIRQSGFLPQQCEKIGRVDGRRSGFPEYRVSHHGR